MKAIDEILEDLRSYVAGRGREDNFCYSKIYSPSSGIRCVDFSRWIGIHLVENDIRALAVFKAQLSMGDSFGVSVTVNILDNEDDSEIGDEEEYDEEENNNGSNMSFDREVNRYDQEIKHILQFPFEEYFANDIRLAKLDLLIAWLLVPKKLNACTKSKEIKVEQSKPKRVLG